MKIYIGFAKSLHGLSCISIISCHGSGWCWKPAEGKTWLCCGQRIAGCDSLPFPRQVVEESWSVLWVWVALGGEQYLQDRLKGSASTNLRSDFSIYWEALKLNCWLFTLFMSLWSGAGLCLARLPLDLRSNPSGLRSLLFVITSLPEVSSLLLDPRDSRAGSRSRHDLNLSGTSCGWNREISTCRKLDTDKSASGENLNKIYSTHGESWKR